MLNAIPIVYSTMDVDVLKGLVDVIFKVWMNGIQYYSSRKGAYAGRPTR